MGGPELQTGCGTGVPERPRVQTGELGECYTPPMATSRTGHVAPPERREIALTSAGVFLENRELPLSVRAPKQGDLHLHRHEFTELVVVLNGTGDHLFDEHRFPILAGDAFVIDVNHAHGYRNTRDLGIVNVLFDERFLLEREPSLAAMPSYQAFVHLEPFARQRLNSTGKLRLSTEAMEETRLILHKLERELETRSEGYIAAAVSLLVELIVLLCRCYAAADDEGNRDLTDMGRVVGYLENHYASPVEITDLLALVAMSERSLLRKFSRATGTTPIQYLLRVRVSHAARLLRTTTRPVTEISGAVGFEDSNYFSRQFRQIVGVCPSAYRRGRTEV